PHFPVSVVGFGNGGAQKSAPVSGGATPQRSSPVPRLLAAYGDRSGMSVAGGRQFLAVTCPGGALPGLLPILGLLVLCLRRFYSATLRPGLEPHRLDAHPGTGSAPQGSR